MSIRTTLALTLMAVTCGPVQSDEPHQLASTLHWKRNTASVALMNGDRVVWQFNHLADGKEQGVPYFHPLATLEGAVLTDRKPADHLWHRGLRFAWKKINGLEGYWAWPEGLQRWPENNGMTEVTQVKASTNADYSARFELELTYHPPGQPPVLTEKRTIDVGCPDSRGTYRIDMTCVFTASSQDALLDRTPIPGEPDGKPWGGYAGLQFRVAPREKLAAWSLQAAGKPAIRHKIDAPRSVVRDDLLKQHGKQAKWMKVGLEFRDGKRGGVVLLDHPGNLRHPTNWHVSSMPNELIQTPLFASPYRLPAGKQLTMRYRILVYSSELAPAEIGRIWQQFAK